MYFEPFQESVEVKSLVGVRMHVTHSVLKKTFYAHYGEL